MQFWDLTPRELVFQLQGWIWRQEQAQWRTASIVAAIYDVNRNPKKRRKPITAADVMGVDPHAKRREERRRARRGRPQTLQEQREILERFTRGRGGTVRYRGAAPDSQQSGPRESTETRREQPI